MPEEQTEQAQDQDQVPAERVQDQDQDEDEQQPGPDDFAARTAAAEDLPLPERADAFAALHDELRTRLESGQAPPAERRTQHTTEPTTGHTSGRVAGAGQVWGSGRRDGGQRA
ncbi:hypothetical protein [Curtobacterium sp. NPDC089185]|uniref:hypothetical protein n=1 Tax=Curtobacterium sp. NPDC089185 TaxID=3154968 RepID=UPI00343BD0A2